MQFALILGIVTDNIRHLLCAKHCSKYSCTHQPTQSLKQPCELKAFSFYFSFKGEKTEAQRLCNLLQIKDNSQAAWIQSNAIQQKYDVSHIYNFKFSSSRIKNRGISWRSSGWDSALSLQRTGVRSLVGEQGSHKLHSRKKKKKVKNKQVRLTLIISYLT